MRNRKLVTLALSATAVVGTALVAPAASAGEVTTSLTVTAGALSIASAAATADLGTAATSPTGATLTGKLPQVTVTDARASAAGWTSKVASTSFVNGTQSITADKARAYIPSADGPTLVSGVAVPTTTATTPATGVVLSGTAANLVTATATGSNQVVYTPNLQVTLDSTVLAGTYTGTVTHTVV